MGIGYRIKEARERLGLTQTELGEMVGVTGSAITNYEKETSHPKEQIIYKLMEKLKVDANYLFQDAVKLPKSENDINLSEYEHIKKYRSLDTHGRDMVDTVLEKEAERMAELEASRPTVIDIQPHLEDSTRLIEYHRSASAGTGVFILGSEGVEQIPIPNTPENRKVDYAIKVSGSSMEPDYFDGDIVLVSQKVELNHGDVGIFIVNNDAYIKEYGETELISRNPDADNIIISEYDNIVCMGKVVGKYKV